MTRRIPRLALALTPFVLAVVVGCTTPPDPWAGKPGVKVLAYFPPLYCFAANVGGADANVQSLLTTQGPHDFEPTRGDARRLEQARLFFINGLGLDDTWGERLVDSGQKKVLELVKLGEAIPAATRLEGGCNCGHEHKHDHAHSHFDPHVWLGIPEAIAMTEAIRDHLAKCDPDHAAGYTERAAAFTARLKTLQTEGQALLASKKEKARLLTHHDSMRYFARTFGIEIVDSIEMPGREPTAARLNELVAKCKEKQTRLIAIEPQSAANSGAQALVSELRRQGMPDAAFVELDPLETVSAAELTPDWYERKMRANLDALAKVLK